MSDKKEPMIINEKPGKKLYCLCGKTKNPPYCDGSHEATDVDGPYEMEIEEDTEVKICTCGQTANPPFCDGTHINC
jgi:CDGSH-type Zn-finger protein